MDPNKLPRKLWEHPDPKSTAMWKFMQDLNRSHGLTLDVSLVPIEVHLPLRQTVLTRRLELPRSVQVVLPGTSQVLRIPLGVAELHPRGLVLTGRR